ncbi:hypothetical protein BEH94_00070 [Candidatus Altiarchaeales archaeon WOR_SM1_SCG]|nr:hypothetical protein BEH94_00070 [Candidatus Altiarchaeales archaeon WOR_SM1_SCG]
MQLLKMYKKHLILLLFLAFSLIQGTYAGDPHAIWGYCRDGHDGTSAIGSSVSAYIEGREFDMVITRVGSNHEYLIDAGEFSIWETGDIVVINIKKGECYADKKIFLDAVGAQRVPDMALTCLEGSGNATTENLENEIYKNLSALKTLKHEETKSNNDLPGNYFIGIILIIAATAILFIFLKKKQPVPGDATVKIPAKSLPEFTKDEIKVIKALAVEGSTENEISGKLGAGALYILKKLNREFHSPFKSLNFTYLKTPTCNPTFYSQTMVSPRIS